MTKQRFIELADSGLDAADVILLPLPFEGTASYGQGTAHGPTAILKATEQTELWDEEVDFNFDQLSYHIADPVIPLDSESPGEYLDRVAIKARQLWSDHRLLFGIGGEHSVTFPLTTAHAATSDLSDVTVVQFDAHADLRSEYEGSQYSHACVMHRLVEQGAQIIAIGIRSAERAEFEYGQASGRVETFFAQELATSSVRESELIDRFRSLDGKVYLTFDIDGLEVNLCPATGTPQPGGLTWWQALRYLKALFHSNRTTTLIGCDIVETVPQPGTRVNEFTAARLLCKIVAYHFGKSEA